MNKIFYLKLDLKKNNGKFDGIIQYDNNTNIFDMKIFDGNKQVEIENGKDFNLFVKKPCGGVVKLECIKTPSNTIQATLTDYVLSRKGICECELKFTKDKKVLTAGKFYFTVRESIIDNNLEDIPKNPYLPNEQGPQGPIGPQGPSGKTPVVYVDYFTDEDMKLIAGRVSNYKLDVIEIADIDKFF